MQRFRRDQDSPRIARCGEGAPHLRERSDTRTRSLPAISSDDDVGIRIVTAITTTSSMESVEGSASASVLVTAASRLS